eukprot:m.298352 g.298352  ORF g.298352 m.298352 type:complete len:52 (+) comp27218_c0_seq2:3673-3828(+)
MNSRQGVGADVLHWSCQSGDVVTLCTKRSTIQLKILMKKSADAALLARAQN